MEPVMKTVATIAASLILASSAPTHAADPLKCDFSGIPGPLITVKLESRDLTGGVLLIPAPYLMSRAREGEIRETLLLSVWRETMLPYTRADLNSEDQRQKYKIGKGEDLTILISPLTDLETIVQRTIRSNYDLDTSNSKSKATASKTTRSDGLIAQSNRPIPRFDELLFSRDETAVKDVFQCSQLGDVPTPGCTHIFEVGAYDVKISYRRELLDNWRTYKQRVAQLLECFTTEKPKDK
jgi:hypothetical protein